tara:strand:+ start:2359 stop:4218 length:1860 start_codon:yes stop_codon:yes gene_type:complete
MSYSTRKLKEAEKSTDTNPTERQKHQDSYHKGKVTIKGFAMQIENPIGSIRSGVDRDGNRWSTLMTCTYGEFLNTVGKDGDPVDVFIGPQIDVHFDVYVIDQVKEDTRVFDEHKVMFGFGSQQEATRAYRDNYQANWTGFDNIISFSLDDFKQWLEDPIKTKQPAKSKIMPQAKFLNAEDTLDQEKMINIKLIGEVLDKETLTDLQNQTGEICEGETLVIEIASPGGSVSEGLQIMMWLEQLSQMGVRIITVVTANAYSIASLIMLAADIRLVSTHAKVMVHNPMVPELSYANANELEEQAASLRELESFMYELYQNFTGLDREAIKLLMDNETYLLPNEAVAKGFADMVVNIKQVPYEMANKPNKQINMSSTINMLKQVIAKVNGSQFVNQLYYNEAGGAVEIYQADASQYQTGDRTDLIDGDHKLSDGSTLTITGGVITEITKGDVIVEDDLTSPALAPQVPIIVEDIVEKPVPGIGPSAAEFNEGPAPANPMSAEHEKMAEHDKPMAAEHEKMAEHEEKVPMSAFKALEEKLEMISAKLDEKMAEHDKKMIDQDEKMSAQSQKSNKFQDIATEAIESIVNNTVSGFKPSARVVSEQAQASPMGETIFQKAKRLRGL